MRMEVKKMNMKKTIRNAAIGLTMLSGANVQAADQYVIAYKDKITLDSAIAGPLGQRVSFIAKARIETPYNGPTSAFAIVDLATPITKGVGAVFETQYSSDGVTPRIGLDYFKKIGPVKVYTEATVGKHNLESFTNIDITKGKLSLGIVSITNVSYNGKHNFSVEEGRLGYNWKGTNVGVALDCKSFKNCKPGVYVSKTF